MNSLFIQLILLFALSCLAAGNSSAESNASRGDAEPSNSAGKIEELNYAHNSIKFHGVNYHYTPSTLINIKTNKRRLSSVWFVAGEYASWLNYPKRASSIMFL